VKIISLNKDELLAHQRECIEILMAERDEVVQVRLLGSLARGDYTGISDVDLLIITKEDPEKAPHKRILRYLPYFTLTRGVDILVLTEGEVEDRLASSDRFLNRVWDESTPLSI
jgi:uncharacterized protein